MAIELKLAQSKEQTNPRGLRALLRRVFTRRQASESIARPALTGRATRSRLTERLLGAARTKKGFHCREEQRAFENALARSRESAQQERGIL